MTKEVLVEVTQQARQLIGGLGGAENVTEVEPCSTRIRVVVKSLDTVNDAALRIPGVLGVITSGQVVQIVAGSISDDIAFEMLNMLGLVWEPPEGTS